MPNNSWIGATGDTQKRVDNAIKVFQRIEQNIVTFISAEPLLENITLNSLAMVERLLDSYHPSINWLIIGGQSKSTRAKTFQPPKNWVGDLLKEADEFDIKVYLKPNLHIVKEYP